MKEDNNRKQEDKWIRKNKERKEKKQGETRELKKVEGNYTEERSKPRKTDLKKNYYRKVEI